MLRKKVLNGRKTYHPHFTLRFYIGLALVCLFIFAVLRTTNNDGSDNLSHLRQFFSPDINYYIDSLKEFAYRRGNDKDMQDFISELYKKVVYTSDFEYIDNYSLNKNLLTVNIGKNKGLTLDSIDDLDFYANDPRLVWSVYFDHLTNNHESGNELPFSWYDFADFNELNKLIAIEDQIIQCPFLNDAAFERETLYKIERELNEPLFTSDREKYEMDNWYQIARKGTDMGTINSLKKFCKELDTKDNTFKRANGLPKFRLPFSSLKINDRVKPEVLKLQARNYLLSNVVNPLSVTILEGDKAAYRFNVKNSVQENIIQSGLLKNYLDRNMKESSETDVTTMKNGDVPKIKHDHIFDHFDKIESFLKSKNAKDSKVHIPDASYGLFDEDTYEVVPTDFRFNTKLKIKELEARNKNQKDLSLHEKNYLNSLKSSIRTHPALMEKYFQESSNVQQYALGGHRDRKFFNGGIIDDPTLYAQKMNSMIRTFQKFTKANGIVSWLSHGTLYGYLYNGRTFPWDNDFDLQLPIKHLHLLAQHFNQSLIIEDPREGNGKYMIDVGTSITVRTKGNSRNNIDARFIDIDSGMYIDLTGIGVTSAVVRPYLDDEWKKRNEEIDWSYHDESKIAYLEYGEGLAQFNLTDLDEYSKQHPKKFTRDNLSKIKECLKNEAKVQDGKSPMKDLLPNERYFKNDVMNVYTCRNNHGIFHDDLSPLINTYFHGVPALIPHKYVDVLKREYKVRPEIGILSFKGNSYIPELRSWVNQVMIKKSANQYGWYPNLINIDRPMKAYDVGNVKMLLFNMLLAGYEKDIALLYTSFDNDVYRAKEIEISFNKTISKDDKIKLLHALRTKVGANLPNPYKDPLLYELQKKLYDSITSSIPGNLRKILTNAADLTVVGDLWARLDQVKSRKVPFFDVEVEGMGSADKDIINKSGLDIFKSNSLDKILVTSPDIIQDNDKN